MQYICDEIAVMYLEYIVEQSDRVSLFRHPLHPYSWALLSAVPSAKLGESKSESRVGLKGDPPSPIESAPGCRFAPSCPFAEATDQICWDETPRLTEMQDGHKVACHQVTDEGIAPQDRV